METNKKTNKELEKRTATDKVKSVISKFFPILFSNKNKQQINYDNNFSSQSEIETKVCKLFSTMEEIQKQLNNKNLPLETYRLLTNNLNSIKNDLDNIHRDLKGTKIIANVKVEKKETKSFSFSKMIDKTIKKSKEQTFKN